MAGLIEDLERFLRNTREGNPVDEPTRVEASISSDEFDQGEMREFLRRVHGKLEHSIGYLFSVARTEGLGRDQALMSTTYSKYRVTNIYLPEREKFVLAAESLTAINSTREHLMVNLETNGIHQPTIVYSLKGTNIVKVFKKDEREAIDRGEQFVQRFIADIDKFTLAQIPPEIRASWAGQ